MGDLNELIRNILKMSFDQQDEALAKILDILQGGMASWEEVLKIGQVLKPICMTIIAICLLIEVTQTLQRVDALTFEHAAKFLIKIVLAKVMIDIAPSLLLAIYQTSVSWITGVKASGGDVKFGELIYESVGPLMAAQNGLWKTIGLFLTATIVQLCIMGCAIITLVIAYGRMFELYVHLAVFPIPCSFLPLSGGNETFSRITIRFLKSFAAIALQGVLMAIVIRVYTLVMTTYVRTKLNEVLRSGGNVVMWQLCLLMMLASIVMVMALTKCGTWSKQIMDAA